ncbi:hypothetical protein [Clostridium sp. Marseille-QA1073]
MKKKHHIKKNNTTAIIEKTTKDTISLVNNEIEAQAFLINNKELL